MRSLWMTALAGMGALACSNGNDGGNAGEAPHDGKLRALTYNTALAPDFEPLTEVRKPLIEAALSDLATDLDVLCVQEYWKYSDLDDLDAALDGKLDYGLRHAPVPGSGACSDEDLSALGGCVASACGTATGIDLVACAQTECAEPIQSIDGGCLGCFLDHLEDTEFSACYGDAVKDPALFGGTFDVGLFARYPLIAEAALEYDSYFVRAAALFARIDVPELGPVDTFCTHLGSSLGVIPYQGRFSSWEGEHAHQVEQLIDFISANASGANPVLVLGDLNMGPASAGPPPVSAELPDDLRALLDSGLDNAVTDEACTLCSDNVLRGEGSADTWVDHVLVRGFSGPVSTERILREPFTLSTPDGDVPMNLSDHYGLRAELSNE
ncbi:MAG TPA: endonuclease/exonuclease/phosphatase family protein [Polyangiaceae bacterium]